MKFVAISDTHGMHSSVTIPECDVLIHAGDCTGGSEHKDLFEFLSWLNLQPAKNKVLIAGNHDWAFEKWPDLAVKMVKEVAPTVTYLQDSGLTIGGLKLWGSPVQPEFCNWAFNRRRGPDIRRHWDMIPEGTDILITHGPARGLLDISGFGNVRVGCEDLLEKINKINPKFHIFGHIHHSYGSLNYFSANSLETKAYNCSICNEAYQPINKPHVFEV